MGDTVVVLIVVVAVAIATRRRRAASPLRWSAPPDRQPVDRRQMWIQRADRIGLAARVLLTLIVLVAVGAAILPLFL